MSLSDLDLPLLPSSDQIRRREFATVRRGYDADQVRDYLIAVAAQVEALEAEIRETRLDPGASGKEDAAPESILAKPEASPYEELAKRLASVIEAADSEANGIVDEAGADARRMLEEARSEADRIRVDAQARAEEARQLGSDVLEKAKIEAERTLSSLSSRREGLVHQLTEMQSKLLSVARDIDATIDERGRWTEDAAETEADEEPETKTETETATEAGASTAGDVVDPRYEELWVSSETVDLPDLTSIELDFDDGGTDSKS
jgi:DivIVA domain-containing protein